MFSHCLRLCHKRGLAPAEDEGTTDKSTVEEEAQTEVVAEDAGIDASAESAETPSSEERGIPEPADAVTADEPVVEVAVPAADEAAGIGEWWLLLHDEFALEVVGCVHACADTRVLLAVNPLVSRRP